MTANLEVDRALALPARDRGPAILAIVEDQWFERKDTKVSPLALANCQISLANADGGTIVVGASNGQVMGTDSMPEHRNELMQSAINFTQPPVRSHTRLIECVNDRNQMDHLMVIEIDPSEKVHSNQKDEVFLRVGDEDRKLSYRQRDELLYDKGQSSFEATIVRSATVKDLNRKLIEDYAAALGHPDTERLLIARSLVLPSGELTAACILLFAEHPQQFLPEAFIRILRYSGTQRRVGRSQNLRTDQRIEGPIPIALMRAREAIKSEQPRRRALTREGTFADVPSIPEDAWLEGVVNAAIHRSYSLGGDHIRVEIFDDRIEVESPGRFPGLISLADPLHATRFARNPRIARVCSDLAFGQELGEGIRRMFQEMRSAGLADPLYEQRPASVRLTLLALPVDREIAAQLPSGSQAVIGLLRRNGPLGTGEIADYIGLSRPAALKRLNALREAGLLRWNGKSARDPRAVWYVE